jgi:hypothetical protein
MVCVYVWCLCALQEVKQLKQLMSALSSHGDGDEAGAGGAPLASPRRAGFNLENREMAFVLTDIESSTELSSRDGRAFKQVGSDGCCPVCLLTVTVWSSATTQQLGLKTSHARCTPSQHQAC